MQIDCPYKKPVNNISLFRALWLVILEKRMTVNGGDHESLHHHAIPLYYNSM